MQIATVGDANTALLQLYDDLESTQQQINSVNTSTSSYLQQIGGSIDKLFGGTGDGGNTTVAATSLVTQLLNTTASIQGEIAGQDPGTALTAQELAQLSELQKDVIADRKLIGLNISNVDWSLGGIFSDAVTIVENTASQAVTGLSQSLGINWTLIAIALIIVAAVYLGLWNKVVG